MGEYILEMRGITKRYPGVVALKDVDLALRPAEVHCLLGENGAGKSTLMKILAGAQPMDEGEILLDGEPVTITSPLHAQELGISMIYQEFNLSPFLSVAENIFLGRAPCRGRMPIIDWKQLYRDAEAVLGRIRVSMDVRRPVHELSIAQQQMVEIAKALSVNARIIVMDEPSATLTDHELDALFALIQTLKHQGIALVYISHRLEEVFETSTRATIMRDGEHVATRDLCDLTREDIIKMMVGRELKEEFPKETFPPGEERLRVEGLTRKGVFADVGFSVHAGEIVGLTGLVGAGRTEVARAIFGADRLDAGRIYLNGQAIDVHSPRDAIRQRIGLLPEDRKNQGLVLGMTVAENTTLANLKALAGRILMSRKHEWAVTEEYVASLRIKTPGTGQRVQNLSGGNQQKVVLAKWLFTQSRLLIFDEPTRGIDVGAKVEIYRLMVELNRQGVGILVISSELPEAIGMCDRILVMHEGRIAGEVSAANATQEAIMALATGTASAAAGA